MPHPTHSPSLGSLLAASVLPSESSQPIKFSVTEDPSYSCDTLANAQLNIPSYTPSKPKLESPQPHCLERKILDSLDRMYSSGAKWREMHIEDIENVEQKLKKVSEENSLKLKESAERTQNSNAWEYLKKAGAFLLAAISTVLGMALVSTGGGALIGGAMIASGITTLANLAFTEAGLWDWVATKLVHENEDLRRKVATLIPAAISLVCAGIGIVGGLGSTIPSLTNALTAGGNIGLASGITLTLQKFLGIMDVALNIAIGGSTVLKGINDYRNLNLRADMTQLKQELNTHTDAIERSMGAMERFQKAQARISESAAQIITMTIDANQRILMQV